MYIVDINTKTSTKTENYNKVFIVLNIRIISTNLSLN